MKTTSNATRAITMAAVIFTAFVLGTYSSAQPFLNLRQNDGVQASFDRLEVMMSSVEQASRYKAPSVEYDEIQGALNRLDLLASKTENQIRYKVPDEAEVQLIEYAIQGKDQEFEKIEVIALRRGTPKLPREIKD